MNQVDVVSSIARHRYYAARTSPMRRDVTSSRRPTTLPRTRVPPMRQSLIGDGGTMLDKRAVSRRGFVGGVATALGYLGLEPGTRLWAQAAQQQRQRATPDEYDALAKLANNENPYGP